MKTNRFPFLCKKQRKLYLTTWHLRIPCSRPSSLDSCWSDLGRWQKPPSGDPISEKSPLHKHTKHHSVNQVIHILWLQSKMKSTGRGKTGQQKKGTTSQNRRQEKKMWSSGSSSFTGTGQDLWLCPTRPWVYYKVAITAHLKADFVQHGLGYITRSPSLPIW